MSDSRTAPAAGDRLAKVIARAGLCSRRDAEAWIAAGRVTVNGKKVITPAFNVTERDKIAVDGQPLAQRQGTRVWLYHKPAGLVVTEKDPEGRATVFEAVERLGLPRVLSVGRLDINTEGLLLLTNDGGLKRVLELPETGWLRRYRVRAHGSVTQAQLDSLKHGVEVDGVRYGEIEASLEREQGANVWLTLALREGKNREVRNVLEQLGLTVNRLIRVSYGPFQLGDIAVGAIETVKARVLRDQLGKKLAEAAGVDFDSEMPELGASRPRGRPVHGHKTRTDRETFSGRPETRRAPHWREDDDLPDPRRIHFDDGESVEFRGRPAKREGAYKAGGERPRGDRPAFDKRPGRPQRDFGEKSRTPSDTGVERRPRHRRDNEAGGQADARQSRPFREERGPRGASRGAPRSDGPRPDRARSDRPVRGGPRTERARTEGGERPRRTDAPMREGRPTRPGDRPQSRPGAQPSGPGAKPGRPGARPGAGGPGKPRGPHKPGGPRKPGGRPPGPGKPRGRK
jgi:23S rRNA pseudouridine2605 synthase